jgi:hypothetical protein
VSAALLAHGAGSKGPAFPADPVVPPQSDQGPMLFCDPAMGMEPAAHGRCSCMPGARGVRPQRTRSPRVACLRGHAMP